MQSGQIQRRLTFRNLNGDCIRGGLLFETGEMDARIDGDGDCFCTMMIGGGLDDILFVDGENGDRVSAIGDGSGGGCGEIATTAIGGDSKGGEYLGFGGERGFLWGGGVVGRRGLLVGRRGLFTRGGFTRGGERAMTIGAGDGDDTVSNGNTF